MIVHGSRVMAMASGWRLAGDHDVAELAWHWPPPQPLPPEWRHVHALRRARAAVDAAAATGHANLAASVKGDKERRRRALDAAPASASGAPNGFFSRVLIEATTAKCRLRTALLALALATGSARLRRTLASQVAARRHAETRAKFLAAWAHFTFWPEQNVRRLPEAAACAKARARTRAMQLLLSLIHI